MGRSEQGQQEKSGGWGVGETGQMGRVGLAGRARWNGVRCFALVLKCEVLWVLCCPESCVVRAVSFFWIKQLGRYPAFGVGLFD